MASSRVTGEAELDGLRRLVTFGYAVYNRSAASLTVGVRVDFESGFERPDPVSGGPWEHRDE